MYIYPGFRVKPKRIFDWLSTSHITEERSDEVKYRIMLSLVPSLLASSFPPYCSTLHLGSPFCCLVITNSGSTLLSATLQALCSAVPRERRGFRNKCRLNRLYQPRKFSVSRSSHSRSLWFVCFLLASLTPDTSPCLWHRYSCLCFNLRNYH